MRRRRLSRMSHPAHEVEDDVAGSGQTLVSEVGVEDHVLLRRDLVVGGELGGGRADRVHQPGQHQHFARDSRGEVLHVYVAELGLFSLMVRRRRKPR